MKGFRRRPPTHDELGLKLIKRWNENVAYFFGQWQIHENGAWRPRTEAEVNRDLWQIQIDHKPEGIEPSQGRCASIEHFCRAQLTISPDKLNKSDEFINLKNGVYSIREQWFGAHDWVTRDYYLTHQLPFEYKPDAKCPQWQAFVRATLIKSDGSPDEQLINLFQEMCYYCLTAETHHRAAFFIVGPKGSGKSTLVNILIAIAGSSHESFNLEQINDPYTLAKLAGKRLATFSEPETNIPLSNGAFKKLVSKDPVPARQIYGAPFSFVPKCKPVGSMNTMPRIRGADAAVFDRIIIIPTTRAVPMEARDLFLEDRLKNTELPGIFNWMMEGSGRLKMQGRFTTPEQTKAAIDEYQFENDNPRQWVEEVTEQLATYKTTLELAHNSFQQWSTNSGYQGMGKIGFRRELNRLGFQHIKTGGNTYILGLRLKESGKMF